MSKQRNPFQGKEQRRKASIPEYFPAEAREIDYNEFLINSLFEPPIRTDSSEAASMFVTASAQRFAAMAARCAEGEVGQGEVTRLRQLGHILKGLRQAGHISRHHVATSADLPPEIIYFIEAGLATVTEMETNLQSLVETMMKIGDFQTGDTQKRLEELEQLAGIKVRAAPGQPETRKHY